MCQMARMIQQMPCPQSPICKENLGKHLYVGYDDMSMCECIIYDIMI